MGNEHIIVKKGKRAFAIGEMSCRLDLSISENDGTDDFRSIEIDYLTPAEVAAAALKMLEVACLYVKDPAEIMALVEAWSKGDGHAYHA